MVVQNFELLEGGNVVQHLYSALNGKIVEKYGTQTEFAKAMELSQRTISLKLNSKIDWKTSEIIRACDLLEIEKEEIPKYFFTLKVQSFEQRKQPS